VELGQVLGALPPIVDPNVLHDAAARDDAAVYRIAPDRALVATVDFFTPIVDDPAAYGAIAAAHALSDVYAAGPVVGGHSVDDEEPKFGYAVIGEAHPARLVAHDGARPGDVLFLTKPLGSGLVATAIKRGLCPPDLEREAIAIMTALNRGASEAMVEAAATAATDVTGYGLIGHLANLTGGADLDFESVPFMNGAGDLAERDLFPDGSRRNHAAYRDLVEWGGLGETEQLMLCDAQTSGGLLIAIPPANAEGFRHGVRIGVMRDDGAIRVRP